MVIPANPHTNCRIESGEDHLESVYNIKNSGVIHLDAITRLNMYMFASE
jgi:hypothetical protein